MLSDMHHFYKGLLLFRYYECHFDGVAHCIYIYNLYVSFMFDENKMCMDTFYSFKKFGILAVNFHFVNLLWS